MIISDGWRLTLYVLMGIFPIWSDYFAKSMDISLRGLAMPLLASASAAVAIALAKTSSKTDDPVKPMPVKTLPGKPLETTETVSKKPKAKKP